MKLFKALDPTNLNQVFPEGLDQWLKVHNFIPTSEELVAITRRIDTNADGVIDFQDFRESLQI